MNRAALIVLLVFLGTTAAGQDTDPPEAPVLERVSVDPSTHFSALWWTASPSADVTGYIIYRYIGNEGFALDTLYDPQATYYLYTKTPARYFTLQYVVAALDTAGNVSPLSNAINTIFLEAELDTCNSSLLLDWNGYSGFDPPVDYSVISSLDQSDYEAIHSLQDTVWALPSFETGATYCFYIRAINSQGDTASSNKACITTDMLRPPEWIRARSSSLQEGTTRLVFSPEPGSELNTFDLYQYPTEGGDGTIAGRYSWDGSGDLEIELPSAVINGSGIFRLAAINTCDQITTWSDSLTTLFLRGRIAGENLHISWNPLLCYTESERAYALFRRMGEGNPWTRTASPGATDTSFQDALSGLIFNPEGHKVSYYLKGLEENSAAYPSLSNIISIELPVRIYVPNAFTPDGNLRNETFRPVLSFTPATYTLTIRNRSGTEVFSSPDPLEAWDGTFRGDLQPEGTYIWHLKVTTLTGASLERTGQVTILLPGN